jgi:hypothetical protein
VTSRLTILILLLLSFALGPVQMTAASSPAVKLRPCHQCCGPACKTCCVTPDKSAPQELPVSTLPQSPDAKQMVAPVLFLIGACVEPAVATASTRERQVAGMPVRARLDVTGIRLI